SASFLFSNTRLVDVMDTNFYKINESTLIEDCALVMKENKTAFLPVVDGSNTLTGVITSYDVLKGLMRLMDIRGEGCRLVVKSTDVAGLSALVARSGKIKNMIVDGENTIIKFESNDGSEIKERVNSQYDVVYYKEL
ncbi:MAG: CBS domain-containing protein, partial [Firmicutes bacterium]|nr:CBS domain-containing protein [Bacillota bacterium]